jgi:ABC-type transport system involved in cytochrome bd biosynthesis fused ATPase/permease subunit
MYSALITAFLMGLEALREGELAGVNLAVITLLPLAIFDGIPALIAPLSSMGKIDRATKAIDNLAVYPQGERGSMPIKADEVLIELCEARAKWGASSLQHMPISTEFVGSVPTLVQGESGIGKTSLAYALSGLIDYEGSITVNGVELRKLDLVGLRRISTILLQEEHLFASSLRENLRIAKPGATDDELFETLVKVEMDVTVRNLPYGLDTIVGAFGTNFSSGEKQRFRLARVFLRDSQFYLLDEPFEHLTLEQAERIMGRILSHCFGRTLVIISHQAHSWAHNRVVLKTH